MRLLLPSLKRTRRETAGLGSDWRRERPEPQKRRRARCHVGAHGFEHACRLTSSGNGFSVLYCENGENGQEPRRQRCDVIIPFDEFPASLSHLMSLGGISSQTNNALSHAARIIRLEQISCNT